MADLKSAHRTARWARWIVLLAVLALSTALGLLHQYGVDWRPPGVDALCPFGGIEAAYSLISAGLLIRRIAWSSLILLGAILVVALVFKRAFCGLVCPLGTLQEVFGRLGKKVFGRARPTLPGALDRPARYLKYVVFAWFVGATWATAELAIRPYDPWAAYHHLFSPEILTSFLGGAIVLGVSLAGSFVYERFFCKYLCPMGAVLAVLSPLGRFRPRRDDEACTQCTLCNKACPVNVDVMGEPEVTDIECINCNECVTACPVEGALEIATPGGARVSPLVMLGSVVAIIALVIGIFTATGDFAWEVGPGGCGGGGGQHGGDGQRSSTEPAVPEDLGWITGQATFAQITVAVGVPPETFEDVFGVPVAAQDVPLSQTKDAYGFSPGQVRAFAEAYALDPAAASSQDPSDFSDGCE